MKNLNTILFAAAVLTFGGATQSSAEVIYVNLIGPVKAGPVGFNSSPVVGSGDTAGQTWNNLSSFSSTALSESSGGASGITFTGVTGTAASVIENRLFDASDLTGHTFSWISSLSATDRTNVASVWNQNSTTASILNFTGLSAFDGRDFTIQLVAAYDALPTNTRVADFRVNGEFATDIAGALKSSDNFAQLDGNVNGMQWSGTWGSGDYTGDSLAISFARANNTSVLNAFRFNFEPVPEPSTFILASLGFLGLAFRRSRRR